MKTGIDLIKKERAKQIKKYGTTKCHDVDFEQGQLVRAAIFALTEDEKYSQSDWFEFELNVKRDRYEIDNLVKAGALIASEIDRIQALKKELGL